MKKYYSLITRDSSGTWAVEFGDYDREIVQAECEYMYFNTELKRRDMKIICTGDSQACIEAKLNELKKNQGA